MSFKVRVRENSHSMDESEAYDHGTFATFAEAACRGIVDEFLAPNRKPGMGADALFHRYTTFGKEPTIDGAGPGGHHARPGR